MSLNAALSKFRATCKPWAKIRRKKFFVVKFKISKNRNTLGELKVTYSISWQLRDIIKWTLHHICISINNYNFIQRHLTHFLKKEEWKDDFKVYQEWIDSNKHSVSEEDIVRIKTELSQLDEKTYSWLLFSRPMMMMMMMMMINWWIWKMWKWKKNCIPVQFTTRYV